VCGIAADRGANIDIRPAVIIDIAYCHTLTPLSCSAYAGFVRDIFELKITFIEVQPVGDAVAGKIDIGATVAVEVADTHTTAVIEVGHVHGINGVVFDDTIVEIDTGMGRGDLLEQRSLVFATCQRKQTPDGYPDEK
jgi:hypothetical protein